MAFFQSQPNTKAMVSRSPDDYGIPSSQPPSVPKKNVRRVVRIPVMIDVTLEDSEDEFQAEMLALEKINGLKVNVPAELGFSVRISSIIAPKVINPG
jgi:hypothetical protein